MTKADWVFRPEHFLRYVRRVRNLRAAQMQIPPRLLLVFGGDDWRAFRRALTAKPIDWHRWLCVGRARNRRVAVLRTMIGSPAAATALDEAATLGARQILTFGACGSLLKDLPIGSVVVPTRAYSDEGTSRHYGGTRWSRPDAAMVDAIRAACRRHSLPYREGGVWTTDAPYRESRSKARSLVARGVIAVDMEASALYAVAHSRRLRAASVFVVSDELGGKGWNAGFRDPVFRRGKRMAMRAVIDAISRGVL